MVRIGMMAGLVGQSDSEYSDITFKCGLARL